VSATAPSPVQLPATPVAGGRAPLSMGRKVAIIIMIVTVAIAGFLLLRAPTDQHPLMPPARNNESLDFSRGQPWTPPKTTQARMETSSAPASTTQSGNASSFLPSLPHENPDKLALNSPIMAASGSGQGPAPAQVTATRQSGTGATGGESALGARLKPTLLQGSRATLLPHPDLTITQGTKIPCLPQEPIDSTLPGLVTCIVPIDVRGTTGRVILLDRGTKIAGEVQSGLMQGQNRLFVLWTRAETPAHVIITLNSPGADRLGQSGLEGDVNTHFWQRFGGALLLSFIDSGLQAAALAASNSGGGGNSFYNFQSTGQSLAGSALQNSINIPPMLHRDQALSAVVFVARDLDFSGVYGLEVRR